MLAYIPAPWIRHGLWKDPPFKQWENPLFRLGHVQVRELLGKPGCCKLFGNDQHMFFSVVLFSDISCKKNMMWVKHGKTIINHPPVITINI